MGALVIVALAEGVEARLLGSRVRRRRCRRVLLQRPVHALVTAVLLRAARSDPLEPDAELQPVRRKPAQAARAGARKRRPVVAADRLRQPVPAQQPLDHRPHPRLRRRNDHAGQKIAAVGIAHRQRIAALPVPRRKPALEVDAPGVVGRLNRRKGRSPAAPADAAADAAPPIPPAATDRRSSRPPEPPAPDGAADASPRRSLRGPQVGCARRKATISSARSAASRCGTPCGPCERSESPPPGSSAWRAAHLYPVLRLIP